MTGPGEQRAATRSAWLELRDERALMREGYEFLDEKRMIVAAEMQRQLRAWREARAACDAARAEARDALALAAGRHGVEGLTVHPATRLERWAPDVRTRRHLGVELLELGGIDAAALPPDEPALPSIEAEDCRAAFAALLPAAQELALRAANLARLIAGELHPLRHGEREMDRTVRRAAEVGVAQLLDADEHVDDLEQRLDALLLWR